MTADVDAGMTTVARSQRPKFVVRPRLALSSGPPARPPWRRGYGNYCLKASCDVWDTNGERVGKFVGYDRYVHIQDSVEHACRVHVGQGRASTCGDVSLTLLRDFRKECSGEVFFIDDGHSRRVF